MHYKKTTEQNVEKQRNKLQEYHGLKLTNITEQTLKISRIVLEGEKPKPIDLLIYL